MDVIVGGASGELLRLTYAELGERLGITADSARFKAKRRGWRIERGNDGRNHVLVSAGLLAQEVECSAERSRDSSADSSPEQDLMLAQQVIELQAEKAIMADKLGGALTRAAWAEGESKALREQVTDLRRRLDRAESALALPWWRWILWGRGGGGDSRP